MKALLVYCGSSGGNHPAYREAAIQLGKILAQEKIKLVYGGGSVGLMGVLADEVLRNNGEVTGVIPGFLNEKEIGHKDLTEMYVVMSMHERKALMAELCDAVLALPGGIGTMDELFEMLTWAQLGLHEKPIGLLNVNGYYDHFLAHLDHMVREGFLRQKNRDELLVSDAPEKILALLRTACPTPGTKWMQRGDE